MVSVIRRMKMFRGRLAHLRASPGAYLLPSTVRKLELEFAKEKAEGHWGPRKFWRNYLPGLKFYNPDIEVVIKREQKIGGPCVLTIENADGKKTTMNMQNQEDHQIASELFKTLKATPVEVSEEDKKLGDEWVKQKEEDERKEEEAAKRRRKRAEERKMEALEKASLAAV